MILQKFASRLVRSCLVRIRAICNGSLVSLTAKVDISQGGRLFIGRGVRIMGGTVLSVGPKGTLIVDDNVWIGPYNILYCEGNIRIGKNTRIAHFCTVTDHNYEYCERGNYFERPKLIGRVDIGENCWIGAGCSLLKGVCLGDNIVIGAGAVVTKITIDEQGIYVAGNRISGKHN